MDSDKIDTKIEIKGYQATKNVVYCAWCGNKSLMYVVCSGKVTEVYDWEQPQWFADYKWQILLCPSCKETNVLLFAQYEFDEVTIGLDEVGEEITEMIERPPEYLYPQRDLSLPDPHPEMPQIVRAEYEEARAVFCVSYRSAAALLRLAVQKLCQELGEKGHNINDDIKSLVRKGLPEHIQQALDTVRVIGNESVHPGELTIQDNPEITRHLFKVVNEIVDDRIGKAKISRAIRDVYQILPKSKLDSITARDKGSFRILNDDSLNPS